MGTGFFNDWRGHYLDDLDPEATHILTQHVERLTSPWTELRFPHLGGAVARVADTDTAYGNRTAVSLWRHERRGDHGLFTNSRRRAAVLH